MKDVSYDPWPSHRYEEEINRRTAAENEFVLLKKVSGRYLAREAATCFAISPQVRRDGSTVSRRRNGGRGG